MNTKHCDKLRVEELKMQPNDDGGWRMEDGGLQPHADITSPVCGWTYVLTQVRAEKPHQGDLHISMPCFWGLVQLQEQKPLDLVLLDLFPGPFCIAWGEEDQERPVQKPVSVHPQHRNLHHDPGAPCGASMDYPHLPHPVIWLSRGSFSCAEQTAVCVGCGMRSHLEPASYFSSCQWSMVVVVVDVWGGGGGSRPRQWSSRHQLGPLLPFTDRDRKQAGAAQTSGHPHSQGWYECRDLDTEGPAPCLVSGLWNLINQLV